MQFFNVSMTVFGFASVIRTYKNEVKKQNLTTSTLNILIFLFFLTVILCFLANFSMTFAMYFSLSTLFVAYWVTIFVTKQIRKQKTRKELLIFLDKTICFMECGDSFRVSLNRSVEEIDGFALQIFKKLVESVCFSQQNAKFTQTFELSKVRDYLVFVSQHPSETLSRLKNYRNNLKTEEKFRHRSGQKQQQIIIQATTLNLIYFSFLIFMIHEFGFWKQSTVILLSLILNLIGAYLIWNLGKTNPWSD